MPDLDVIVKSLKRCSDMTICPDDCCYRKYAPDCVEKLHRDAINLLKEQNELLKHQSELLEEKEAVAVHDPGAYCPKCGWMLYSEDHPNHCGNCGQAVKWDEP